MFPLPVHIMHVFLFICLSRFSFRFILFCVLRFIIISLLHFAAFASRCCSGTKNSMEILFFVFFFSFFISVRFGWSWGPRKVDSHSRGSDNYFCIQTTRITYQQVALPTVPPLSPSVSLSLFVPSRGAAPSALAFENRFLIFSVLSLVFGSFFSFVFFLLYLALRYSFSLCCR